MRDSSKKLLSDAASAIAALQGYICAIPVDVAAALPAMPGIDGDWLAKVQEQLKVEDTLEALPAQAASQTGSPYNCPICEPKAQSTDRLGQRSADIFELQRSRDREKAALSVLIGKYMSKNLLPGISQEQFEAALKIGFSFAWECQFEHYFMK